jgi:hypothetical protein
MFARDWPTLSPPYQPESFATASGMLIAENPTTLNVINDLTGFIWFSTIWVHCFRAGRHSHYGAGTLTTVLTMVTDAVSAKALPFSVVMVALPDVEKLVAA